MHADRADIVGIADHRQHLPETLRLRLVEQLRHQRLADALPPHVVPYIDAVLGGVAVG